MHSAIHELCIDTPAVNSILNNEIVLDNISEEFSSKGELGTPVSKILAKVANSLFNSLVALKTKFWHSEDVNNNLI